MSFEPGAQIQVAAIDRIGHHPGNGDLSCADALDHESGQFTLRLKMNRVRNPCLSTSLTIVCPWLGKIEFTIQQGVSLGTHVGEKHAHLRVLDLSAGSAIL